MSMRCLGDGDFTFNHVVESVASMKNLAKSELYSVLYNHYNDHR